MSSLGGTNGSMFSFGGLASGLDTNSIINALLQVEAQPIARDQSRIQDFQTQQSNYSALKDLVSKFQSAVGALSNPTAFNVSAATSSDTSVATVTTSSSTSAGTFNLTVKQLAQAEKISSAVQPSTTAALNLSGTFVVNGKSVDVVSNDTLQTIAQKVNGLGAGVAASVIDGGNGQAYLSFLSSSTGVANKLAASDLSGNVLSSLGMLSGASAVRSPITNGAQSISFNSQSTAISSLLNTGNLASSTIQINGVGVTINPTDTLQSIANSINSAGANATASVKSTTDANGVTTYQLQITGTNGSTPTFTDSNNVLGALGILQQGFGNELVKAQDAQFTLDNLNLTSATNTVQNVIPGVTLSLLKGTQAANATATITVSQDTNAISQKIQSFVDAYNGVQDFINTNSKFDSKTNSAGAMLGDAIAEQVSNGLSSLLFQVIPGQPKGLNNLASLGFNLDQKGHLTGSASQTISALQSNPAGFAALFQSTGTVVGNNLSYVSSTPKTAASSNSPYNINITQAATKATASGTVAQTLANNTSEILTFGGTLFAGGTYNLTLDIGSTAQDAVNKINNDSKLKSIMTASLDNNGNLLITSNRFGVGGNFTVSSNEAAAADTSGIGTTPTIVAGLDVAGTINGEAATGNGQFLTGNSGNATTDGLSIQYTGTATGSVGTIQFTKGLASRFSDLVSTFLDTTNGVFAVTDNSLTQRITDLNAEIDQLQTDLAQKKKDLTQKFASMETTISQLQQQANSLGTIGK
ncbi:MAG: flagellar filament capping protein FliD [Armatimonadetes bacterium]|nr:flagellar filament capping protein FliD [Armatimonadota bacterium]